jgi:hypothetical protein
MLSVTGEPLDPAFDLAGWWFDTDLGEADFVRFDDDPDLLARCSWCKGRIEHDLYFWSNWQSMLADCAAPPGVEIPMSRRGLWVVLNGRMMHAAVDAEWWEPENVVPGLWTVEFAPCSRRCALWLRAYDRAARVVAVQQAAGDALATAAGGRTRLVRTTPPEAWLMELVLTMIQRRREPTIAGIDRYNHYLDREFQGMLFDRAMDCAWCGDALLPGAAEVVYLGGLGPVDPEPPRYFADVFRVGSAAVPGWNVGMDDDSSAGGEQPGIIVCGFDCRREIEDAVATGRCRLTH